MKQEISRGDVWNVVLDPARGSEQAGHRPCVVISPDSMNHQLETVIVVPLTTKLKDWPTRVSTHIGDQHGQAMCEQIRTISKVRFKTKLGKLKLIEIAQLKLVLKQMFLE